ncbi:hypothetical protein C7S20_13010 [Christiangramia fulva]|uniref:Beta-carotene 15,15'-monooxygenase n=1 Tax=Christiangramia fulva TaxID=2126553 RepID=A0A2R3Z748_9FLAO|nr:hypothetical protein [Christiangramia fulva]AVR46101.1 hypothetical protein C7S20_13010 [Christiangramia fulva]
MDELDLLKRDWKKQEKNLPHLSYDEIYRMIWKRSSSIVKWIFIISIIEFLLGTVLNIVLADDDYWKRIEEFDLKEFTIWGYVINYIITFYFLYIFYRNYRRISANDTVKGLMKNILHTRKTVKYYIGFVLISSGLTFLVGLYIILHHHALTANTETVSNMHFDTLQWFLFIGVVILILGLVLGIIWLIYRVIYGILLKKLLRNYRELKNLEM